MTGLCRCPDCVTCTERNAWNKELSYCYQGKSIGCEMVAKTGHCPICQVIGELGSTYALYCMPGSESVMG